MIRLRLLFSGRVQGVGFRRFVERQVLSETHVAGYVRNLMDGRVEAELQGSVDVISRLKDVLKQGPTGSRVEQVEELEVPVDRTSEKFEIRR